jgi:preprotein translocase subunit SecA
MQTPSVGDDAVGSQQQPVEPPPTDHQQVSDVLGKAFGHTQRPANLSYSAPTVDGDGEVERHFEAAPGDGATYTGVSRNAPCPCGSGRKFKRCHGAPTAH